jgi:hypothetical protein
MREFTKSEAAERFQRIDGFQEGGHFKCWHAIVCCFDEIYFWNFRFLDLSFWVLLILMIRQKQSQALISFVIDCIWIYIEYLLFCFSLIYCYCGSDLKTKEQRRARTNKRDYHSQRESTN